jgi:BirA family transcriptional regulator, biotin operon repressor / biotin---[acetyl-CoA-carboxylase] ligase
VQVVAETGSTNADLVAGAKSGRFRSGAVLLAEHQSDGRGRRGRSWVSPARSAITMSVLLQPTVPVARWSWLPLLTGLAMADAVTELAGLPVRLKWPNDLLVVADNQELKLAGVLAEIVELGSGAGVVIGLGLNVSQLAQELPIPAATSLRLAGATTTDRGMLTVALLRAIAGRYQTWQDAAGQARPGGLAAAYRERCLTIGRTVRVELPGRTLHGQVEGIDDDGQLLLVDPTGHRQALAAADVVHVRPQSAAQQA